jgi:hypothetical protein
MSPAHIKIAQFSSCVAIRRFFYNIREMSDIYVLRKFLNFRVERAFMTSVRRQQKFCFPTLIINASEGTKFNEKIVQETFF